MKIIWCALLVAIPAPEMPLQSTPAMALLRKSFGDRYTPPPRPPNQEKKNVLQLQCECDFKGGLDTEQDTDSTLT